MVEEKIKETAKFSIERFESVMLTNGIDWASINRELECDVESMLKNKDRQPMLNVINKACSLIGLKNSDYIMGKDVQPKFINTPINQDTNIIKASNIDVDMLHLYIGESRWGYNTISSLMTSKSVFKYKDYSKNVRSIKRDDLNTLCWALQCKITDICTDMDDDKIPNRVINDRQIYNLNIAAIKKFADIETVAGQAHVPVWFINNDNAVSLEMVKILCTAIKHISRKTVKPEEICLNYSPVKNNKKVIKKDVKAPVPSSTNDAIKNICNAIKYCINNKIVQVYQYNVSLPVDLGKPAILETDEYLYIRREAIKFILDIYNTKNKIKSTINLNVLSMYLNNEGILNKFQEGNYQSPTCKLNGYGGSRFFQFNKNKILGGEEMNIPKDVKIAVLDVEQKPVIEDTQETGKEVEKPKYYNTNNMGGKWGRLPIRDVFNYIDHASNDELDKIEEYISGIKRLREIKNSFN